MTGQADDGSKTASQNRNLSRDERRAAELRANLARRKAQARARARQQPAAGTKPGPSGSSDVD